MLELLAVVVGALFAGGVFLMMRRSAVRLLVGISLLSHAANLLLFAVAEPAFGASPIAIDGQPLPLDAVTDPLPQALVLTAIVIGLGVSAFAVILVHRAHQAIGVDDVDELRSTEP